MADDFNPDAYLERKRAEAAQAGVKFDPDAYLKGKQTSGIPPNPDEQAFTLSPEQKEMGEAALRGMAGGASFGLYNRGGGLYDYLTGAAPSYREGVDRLVKREDELSKKYPWTHGIGGVVGGLGTGLGMARAGLTLVRPAVAPLAGRVVAAGAEGALQGAAQGAGQTYTEKPSDYFWNAGKGGVAGAAVGSAATAVGAGASNVYKSLADRLAGVPAPVARAGRVDAAGLANLHRLGPDAMLPDAGPALKATTQAASQGVGENRALIANALTERERGTVGRIRQGVRDAVGPSPQVSAIEREIDEGRRLINATEYGPVLQGRTVPQAEVDNLITEVRRLGQESRENMGTVVRDLHAPGTHGTPQARADTDPQALLTVRHKLDSMIESARSAANPDRHRAMVLTQARERVNNLLETHVPGIREADAKFAANRRELEALERGTEVFDKGKRAIDPRDLEEEMRAASVPGAHAPPGPPRANQRLRQGATADIYRRIGTESDDLRALEKTLGGEADWAREKSSLVFGPRAADEIAETVRRNRVFRDTYSDVIAGSKTGQMLASRADTALTPMPKLAGSLWERIERTGMGAVEALRNAGVQKQRDEIARLMALRDPAEVARIRDLLIAHNASLIPRANAVHEAARAAAQGGANAAINQPQPRRLEIDTSRWR